MTADDLSCSNCRWSETSLEGDEGPLLECRRFPPQMMATADGDVMQGWPQMQAGDWCAEHRPPRRTRLPEPRRVRDDDP